MKKFVGARLFYLFVLSGVVAGCSNSVSGTPEVEGSVPATTGFSNEVPVELSLDSYLERPCEIVPSEVLDPMGYELEGNEFKPGDGDLGGQIAGLTGPACGWGAADKSQSRVLTVTLLGRDFTQGKDIMDVGRRWHSQGQFELWEESQILGYPVVYWGISDKRDQGNCSLLFRISKDSFIGVSSDLHFDTPERACSDVETVTESILQVLRGGL